MSLSLNDIASHKKKPTTQKFKFDSKPKKNIKKSPLKEKDLPLEKVIDQKKPWEAPSEPIQVKHNIESPTTQGPELLLTQLKKIDSLNSKLNLTKRIEDVNEWITSIEVSPQLRIPVPKIFTRSDDEA